LSGGVIYQAKVAGASCSASITAAVGQPLTAGTEGKALTFTELDFSYWSAADLGGGQLTDAPLTLNDRALVRRVGITVKVRGLSSTEPPATMTTHAVVRQGS
jgi:hypothetical protein